MYYVTQVYYIKFIASAACVISIIIDAPAVSYTPKQIDLQAFFVTTAALLCQRVVVNKRIQISSCTIQTPLLFGASTEYFSKANEG